MAPAEVSKDKRMASFIRCITALLDEILYVDDTAMIAPINITDNEEANSRLRRIYSQTLPSWASIS